MFPSVFTDSTFKKGKRLRRTFLTASTPPYGQPQNGQPQYNQPPQPQAPNYSQPQPGGPQYGQPQPPMPGNFPSQQAGAAAKNKPPVAIIIGAVAAVVVIALAAVFFLTNRVSRSDYEEVLVQTQALESSYTAINEEFSSAASATDNDSSSAYDEGKKKDIVDQMADLNLNDIEYGSADYEKLQDLHSKMSDIDSPTLDQSDLQKAAKEADLSGSLKDLETTLSEKIK